MLRYISDPRWIRQNTVKKMRILLLTFFLTEYIILAFSFHLSGSHLKKVSWGMILKIFFKKLIFCYSDLNNYIMQVL